VGDVLTIHSLTVLIPAGFADRPPTQEVRILKQHSES